MTLTADVCIAGSGAGGGVLAIVHVQTGGADSDPRHGGGCPRHTR